MGGIVDCKVEAGCCWSFICPSKGNACCTATVLKDYRNECLLEAQGLVKVARCMIKYCCRVDGEYYIARYYTTVLCGYHIGVGVGYCCRCRCRRGYRQRCCGKVSWHSCTICRGYRPRVRCYRQCVVIEYAECAGRCREADCVGCSACVDARYRTRDYCYRCRCHTTVVIGYCHDIVAGCKIFYSLTCTVGCPVRGVNGVPCIGV